MTGRGRDFAIITFFSAEIRRLRTSSLARNAGWMLVGQGTNLVLQAGYFILLARLLGVKEYGIFAGAFAFVSIATPYSSLGSGLLFVRYVSTNPEKFAVYWGNILLSTIGVGSLIAALLYCIAPHLLNPESASLILLVALAECVCRQLVICIGQIFQAYEQLQLTAGINLLMSLLSLLAASALAVFLHQATAGQWVLASLLVSLLSASACIVLVLGRLGTPILSGQLFRSRLAEGFNFSLGGSTQSVYNDIDKTMLSHYGMNLANGFYTMAYRLVDEGSVPITALDTAALPRYFRRNQLDAKAVRDLARPLAVWAAMIGLLAGGCMLVAAPLIPRIVGRGFNESVSALRWLCLIPAFRGAHRLTGSAITALGFQRYRTMAQLSAAGLNFGLNLWLIPRYGWLGAARASLVTDGTLALLNWTVLQGLHLRALEPRF